MKNKLQKFLVNKFFSILTIIDSFIKYFTNWFINHFVILELNLDFEQAYKILKYLCKYIFSSFNAMKLFNKYIQNWC